MTLSNTEKAILEAIKNNKNKAYGVEISQSSSLSFGTIYATLDKLEQNGLVTSENGEATPERGGRRKKYFSVTSSGLNALENLNKIDVLSFS